VLPIFNAVIAGTLFGLGLTISHMVNPAKVLAFLDLAGDWDPSLAFVMLGALAVTAPAYAFAKRRRTPLCAAAFKPPTATKVDRLLVSGALLFGVGWGLVGYCPGPALASVSFGGLRTLLFVGAMLVGMAAFQAISRDPAPSAPRRRTALQP
jgi:uncharacterized protein